MRRSRQQIIYEILKICRNGVNKNTIVYKSNTNFGSVKSVFGNKSRQYAYLDDQRHRTRTDRNA